MTLPKILKTVAATLLSLTALAPSGVAQVTIQRSGQAMMRSPVASRPPGAPTTLRVEHRKYAPSIDVTSPHYAWVVNDIDRGEVQSAYQILVATSLEKLSPHGADGWNSGRVNSSNSTSVLHNGAPLLRDQRYFWMVRTWDRAGRGGPWSEAASFDVQPGPTTMLADYIWDSTVNPNDTVYMRREVAVPADAIGARLYVTAHESAAHTIEGQRIGRGPAPADPYRALGLQGYDVTDNLLPGTTSTLGVVAHYHGAGSGCGVLGSPAFLLQITFEHENGRTSHLVSDENWRVLESTPHDEDSPLRGPSFSIASSAEFYDARAEPTGWRLTGFDDQSWTPPTVVHPNFVLAAQIVAPETTYQYVSPVSIVEIEPELHLIDFGQNCTGWPVFSLQGLTSGHELRIHYGDTLENGRIIRNRQGMTDYWDHYIARGDAEETWEPDCKYQNFQYIELEGLLTAPDPTRISLRHVHTALDATGTFACSEPLLEDIYAICEQTQRNCTQGVLVDCPDREQTQYMADGTIQALNLASFVEDPGCFRKLLADLDFTQLTPGILFEKAPTSLPHIIPEWTLHFPISLWSEHLLHDSREVLERHKQTLIDILNVFTNYVDPTTGLLTNVPGNALSDHPLDPYDETGEALVVQNCLFVNALDLASKIFATLGQHGQGATYLAQANSVRTAIHANLYLGNGRYRDSTGSSTSHALSSAMALMYKVVPHFERQDTLQYIKNAGFEPSTYGGSYFAEFLMQADEMQHLIDLTLEPGKLWRYMLDLQATTVWEAWIPAASLCHAFTAYPLRFLPVGLTGIEPMLPGYSRIRIHPQPVSQLDWASASIPSPRGPIASRWDRRPNGGLKLEITVPANSVAEVRIPVTGGVGRRVTESGRLIWSGGTIVHEPQGLCVLSSNLSSVLVEVGSGTYIFRTTNG